MGNTGAATDVGYTGLTYMVKADDPLRRCLACRLPVLPGDRLYLTAVPNHFDETLYTHAFIHDRCALKVAAQ